jgi:hypothetical protein
MKQYAIIGIVAAAGSTSVRRWTRDNSEGRVVSSAEAASLSSRVVPEEGEVAMLRGKDGVYVPRVGESRDWRASA